MNKRVEQLNNQWQKEQQARFYHQKFRTIEEITGYWDKESQDYDVRMSQDLRRISAVSGLLARKGLLHKSLTVLEAGCGTGLYSMALAQYCAAVTALDLSRKMGRVLMEKARKSGLHNISFRRGNWTEIDINEAGLYKAFDFSLSALNPAMSSAQALQKLSDTATKACCIVTFAAKPRNKVRDYFEKALLPAASDEETGRRDPVFIFEILSEMGYYPEISYTQMDWVKEQGRKQAAKRLREEYGQLCPDKKRLHVIVEKYVSTNCDCREIFKEYNSSKLSVIYWDV